MDRYSFTPWFAATWLLSGVSSPRRSFSADAQRVLARYPETRVAGAEHLPPEGPFIVVANHYQRRGIGAWWSALAISAAVAEQRPDNLRWMHTSRFGGYRIFGRVRAPETVTACLLRWSMRRYDFLMVDRDEVGPRAPMLRDAYRSLHHAGRAIAIMPEAGDAIDGGVLVRGRAGAGPALAWLSAGRVPLLPVGVWVDEDGRFSVSIGPAFTVDRACVDDYDTDLTTLVMGRVARQLPETLQGVYAGAVR